MSRTDIKEKDTLNKPSYTEEELFRFKYRVTPDTSKLLQEAVFALGGTWECGGSIVQHTDQPFIYVSAKGNLTWGDSGNSFSSNSLPEKVFPFVSTKEFKKGDWVKLVNSDSTISGLTVGKLYQVVRSDFEHSNGKPIVFVINDRGNEDWWFAERFEKVDLSTIFYSGNIVVCTRDTSVNNLTVGKEYIVRSVDLSCNTINICNDNCDFTNYDASRFKKKDNGKKAIWMTDPLLAKAHDISVGIGTTISVSDSTGVLDTLSYVMDSKLVHGQFIDTGNFKLSDTVVSSNKLFSINEGIKMARRVVNIQLFDNDKGLDVEHSLVAAWSDVVTEDSDTVTINEILNTGEVAGYIKDHNDIRVKQINKEILTRTGNSVNLLPIKLKDLDWVVKG